MTTERSIADDLNDAVWIERKAHNASADRFHGVTNPGGCFTPVVVAGLLMCSAFWLIVFACVASLVQRTR